MTIAELKQIINDIPNDYEFATDMYILTKDEFNFVVDTKHKLVILYTSDIVSKQGVN